MEKLTLTPEELEVMKELGLPLSDGDLAPVSDVIYIVED